MRLLLSFLLFAPLFVVGQTRPPRPVTMPAFQFERTDGKGSISNRDLKPGLATVVLFFDPHCEHCQQQAQWLHSGSAGLRGVQFLWVGTAPAAELAAFQQKYLAGSRYPHLVARDTKYQFDGWFGYSVAPTILVFDPAGKLRQSYQNEVSADDIAAQLK